MKGRQGGCGEEGKAGVVSTPCVTEKQAAPVISGLVHDISRCELEVLMLPLSRLRCWWVVVCEWGWEVGKEEEEEGG